MATLCEQPSTQRFFMRGDDATPESPDGTTRLALDGRRDSSQCVHHNFIVDVVPDCGLAHDVIESVIATVVHRALDGRKLGRFDNFFAAGLHSISIARVHRNLQEQLGPLPAAALFQYPCIAHLAAFVRALRPRGLESKIVAGIDAVSVLPSEPPLETVLTDALAAARLALHFGQGTSGIMAAEAACHRGLRAWRVRCLLSMGEDYDTGVFPPEVVETIRQLHLLAASLLSQRSLDADTTDTVGHHGGVDVQGSTSGVEGSKSSAQSERDDENEEERSEAALEALGEALHICSCRPLGVQPAEAPTPEHGSLAEEAVVLAVWTCMRTQLCREVVLSHFIAAAQSALAAQSTGWCGEAGALRAFQHGCIHARPLPLPFFPAPRSHMPGASSFAALTTLQLEELALTQLPSELCARLAALRVFDVSHNRLTVLPAEVGRLAALKTLRLASNALAFLPDEISDLPALTSLSVAGNRIRNAPAEASDCRQLVSFDAGVQSLSAEGGLSAETKQRARRPRAGAAPRSSALETLEVSFSGLAEGPHLETGCGASLRYYLCIGNNLEKCPDLKRCPGLTSLSLGQNLLKVVPLKFLQGLPELRWLSLEANRLAKLPPSVGSLRLLRHLMLQGNRLEVLPEEIGSCVQLRVLEVQHNRLTILPTSLPKLKSLQFFYAHGNALSDTTGVFAALRTISSLKIVGLGGNLLDLSHFCSPDALLPNARLGVAWNAGSTPPPSQPLPLLSELLSFGSAFHFDPSSPSRRAPILVVCFSAQGAPTAQWQGQVQACRANQLDVDALYVCDPANAWYLQDPERRWRGIEYFLGLLREHAGPYGRRVLMLGSSMGATASLLFAELAGLVLAFSPQVELRRGQGRFLDGGVLDRFEARLAASLRGCGGRIVVHVGRRHLFDALAAQRLREQAPGTVHLAYHETEQHNTTKFLHERKGQLTSMVKLAVAQLHVASAMSHAGLCDGSRELQLVR